MTDVAFDIATGAWTLVYMLIALIIPVLIGSFIIRLFGKSARKTTKSFRNSW